MSNIMDSRIILVRHGESVGNIKRDYHPDMNFLTKRGSLQAELAGMTLAQTKYEIDYVMCSPYLRARHTCALLLEGAGIEPEIVINANLKERHYSEHRELPNAESEEDLDVRVEPLVDILSTHLDTGSILCVSHYWTIKSLVKQLGHRWHWHMGLNSTLVILDQFRSKAEILYGNSEIKE